MNSTRRITFVEAPRAAAATFVVAALSVVFLGVTHAGAALQNNSARSVLARAEAMPRGMDRDAALAKAIVVIDDAVKAAPLDAQAHARAARAYFLQATTAAVDEVSAPLLEASARAVAQSLSRRPSNGSALAIQALIDIARHGAATPEAVSAVNASYTVPVTPEGELWRLDAASRVWSGLPLALQGRIIAASCGQARGDVAFAAGLAEIAARSPESGLGRCDLADVREGGAS